MAVMISALLASSSSAQVTTTPANVSNTGSQTGSQTGTQTGSQTGVKTEGPIPTLKNPLKVDSIELLILAVVDIAMNVGIVIATIMIIYSGFRFIWARGNATELEEAKKLFMYVIIGLAVLIAAKAIVGIVKNTLIQAKVVDEKVFQRPQ
jgi:hypothetical protein